MLSKIAAALARYRMLPPRTRVLAAVSGGPDSVALVHALRELNLDLSGIVHVNHKQRGEESDEDERFVVNLSNKMGLPCFIGHLASSGGNLEQDLRRARRDFFTRLLDEGKGTRVALGHTQDDQAETVLLRILRGTGSTGLAGILPVTAEGLIRPLIAVTRAEVLDYLRTRGIPWREDSSNRSLRFNRNRVRHHLLPQLASDWNPQISAELAHLAELAYDEELEWARRVARVASNVLRPYDSGLEIAISALVRYPLALQRRLIRSAIQKILGHLRRIEFTHIESILALTSTAAGSVQIPQITATRSFDLLFLTPATASASAPSLQFAETPAPGRHGLRSGHFTLRTWQPGDRYRPAGDTKVRKLHDLFQRHKIPSWRRHSWPILLSADNNIVWSRKFGPAHEAAGDTVYVYEDEALAGESFDWRRASKR